MSITIGGLQVFIRDDTERFTANFRGAASNVEQQAARMDRAVRGTERSVENLAKSANSINPNAFRALALSALRAEDNTKRLQAAMLAVAALAGGFGGAFLVQGLVQAADTFTQIQNRIATVAKTEAERKALNADIFDIAQRSRAEYGSTATLFARLAASTEKLGASTGDVLRVVETVQKSFSVAGSTTQEAQSAAIQLAQGLASGKLQGDELKSILENNIPLARLLARELAGGDIGKLRELGTAGELDPKSVFQAILRGSGEVDRLFEKTSATTQQSLLRVANALTLYVGEQDQAFGGSRRLAEALDSLADNFTTVANSLLLIGAAFGAVFLGNRVAAGLRALANPIDAFIKNRQTQLKELQEQADATQRAAQRTFGDKIGGPSEGSAAAQSKALNELRRAEEALQKLQAGRAVLDERLANVSANTAKVEEAAKKKREAAEARIVELLKQRQDIEAKAAAAAGTVDRSKLSSFYKAAFDLSEARRVYDDSINAEQRLREAIIKRRDEAAKGVKALEANVAVEGDRANQAIEARNADQIARLNKDIAASKAEVAAAERIVSDAAERRNKLEADYKAITADASREIQASLAREEKARRTIAGLMNRRDDLVAGDAPFRQKQTALYGTLFDVAEARKDVDEIKRLAADSAAEIAKYQERLSSATARNDVFGQNSARLLLEEAKKNATDIEGIQRQANERLLQVDRQYQAAKAELDRIPAADRKRLAADLASIDEQIAAQQRKISGEQAARAEATAKAEDKAAKSRLATMTQIEAAREREAAVADAAAKRITAAQAQIAASTSSRDSLESQRFYGGGAIDPQKIKNFYTAAFDLQKARQAVADIEAELGNVGAKAAEERRAAGEAYLNATRAFNSEEEKLQARQLTQAERFATQIASVDQKIAAERSRVAKANLVEIGSIAKAEEAAQRQRAAIQKQIADLEGAALERVNRIRVQKAEVDAGFASALIGQAGNAAATTALLAQRAEAAAVAQQKLAAATSFTGRAAAVASSAFGGLVGFLGGPLGAALTATTLLFGILGARAVAEAERVRQAQALIDKYVGKAAETGDTTARKTVLERERDAILAEIKALTQQAAVARQTLATAVNAAAAPQGPSVQFREARIQIQSLTEDFKAGKISADQLRVEIEKLGLPAAQLSKVQKAIADLKTPADQASQAIRRAGDELTALDGRKAQIFIDVIERRRNDAGAETPRGITPDETERENRSQAAFLRLAQTNTVAEALSRRLSAARGDEAEKVRSLTEEIIRSTGATLQQAEVQARAEIAAEKQRKAAAAGAKSAQSTAESQEKTYEAAISKIREAGTEARLEAQGLNESKQSRYEATLVLQAYNDLAAKSVPITKERALAIQQAAAASAADKVNLDKVNESIARLDSVRGTLGSTLGGFFNDIASGTSLVESLANAFTALRTAILNALANQAITALLGAPGQPAGGLFGTLLAGVFHEGGVVGGQAPARAMSSAAFVNARRFHTGLKSDEMAAVLQRGERVLTARQNSRMLRTVDGLAKQGGGTSRSSPTVNNHFYGVAGDDTIRKIASQATAEGIRDYDKRGVSKSMANKNFRKGA
jgi:tape measure domain-containing protein